MITPISRHEALIPDLLPDGKRKKEDGTIWTTYEGSAWLPAPRGAALARRSPGVESRRRQVCRNSSPQRLYAADALLTAAHALRAAIHRYGSAVEFESGNAEELE
jgi:hypothetical protein